MGLDWEADPQSSRPHLEMTPAPARSSTPVPWETRGHNHPAKPNLNSCPGERRESVLAFSGHIRYRAADAAGALAAPSVPVTATLDSVVPRQRCRRLPVPYRWAFRLFSNKALTQSLIAVSFRAYVGIFVR